MAFLLASFVVLVRSVYEIVLRRRLRRGGVRVEGVVVRHRQEVKEEGDLLFAVVGFVDAQGGSHEFERWGSGVRGLPVGGKVRVHYLADSPDSARIDMPSMRSFFGLAVPLVVSAGFTAVLGVVVFQLASGGG
ncbi:DUF3592 domain-containing protein [Streptomyces sp. NPDC057702]|uniref:DUF3592 domain-containing protein n=1 Tax=unclassified Streptomyces TaxID=2593676 RepID=UPI00368245B6